MSEERARLFVALELPADVRLRLAGWRDAAVHAVPALRPVASESLHVTLCFLGWISSGEVEAIALACRGVAGLPAAPLRVAEGLWLPPRRPRVLAVALTDRGGGLARAQAALSDALAAGGWYEPESRPFLAHVTVARVQRGARVRGAELPALDGGAEFEGSTVTLFRSRLGRGGARYEGLASVRLDAPPIDLGRERPTGRGNRRGT